MIPRTAVSVSRLASRGLASFSRVGASHAQRLREAQAAVEDFQRHPELPSPEEHAFETTEELRDFVESRILAAMRAGQFDNLSGAGRPLPAGVLQQELMGYCWRIMRTAGLKPQWVNQMHDIDAQKGQIRDALALAWRAHGGRSPQKWEWAVREAEASMVEVNKAVDTFNLTRPQCFAHLFRLRMRLPKELERARSVSPPVPLSARGASEHISAHGQSQGCEEQACDEKKKNAGIGQRRGGELSHRHPHGPQLEKLMDRFVRAAEALEYDGTTWGRRREPKEEGRGGGHTL